MKHTYTLENVKQEALKYSTKKDFSTKSSGYYAAAKRLKILTDVCCHMDKRLAPNKKWDLKSLLVVSSKYDNREDFRKQDFNAYRAAVKQNLLGLICTDMDQLKNPKGFWTQNRLRAEALNYKTKSEFEKKCPVGFQLAHRMGLINEICSHMEILWEKKWDMESVAKEASKFPTRSILLKNSSGAYAAAVRLEILDQICSHMKIIGGSSIAEQSLFDIIKHNYPKTQKLRDRKVKIQNKPHIQGFDIDIYVPELRKGIEFDGDYWHSVPGLLRSREHWPQEDLEQYAKIKDEYFKSKDMELLHISENEWLRNKEECINKCLEFLNI